MSGLKTKVLKSVYDRYMHWRLKDLTHPEYPVLLDYPVRPRPRYGEGRPPHPEINALLARGDDSYRATLGALAGFTEQLARIPETASPDAPGEPDWGNKFFTAMDAVALYSLLGLRRPARYFEVGSGNSTKFARRAAHDLGLDTRIVSLDPAPRAEVDALCDRVIRQPLEDADQSVFDELEAGDVLFIDNSHRVFENSDVTVFFLEVLPRLKPGLVVHVHDIFLPYDYPSVWAGRHYSEQYLLAAYLLAGYARLEVLLPLAYVTQHPALGGTVNRTWGHPVFQRAFAYNRTLTGGYVGTSFWMELK